MIAAIISVLIVLGILRLIPATRELGSDAAIAAVIPAAILNWLLGVAISALELPIVTALAGLTLYFLIPFIWMRLGVNESSKLSAILGGVTFVVVIAVQIGFEILFFGAS